jgi:hypothetical protein
MAEEKRLSGSDLGQGVSLAAFSDGGMLEGHTKGERILVARCAEPTEDHRPIDESPMVHFCHAW